MAKKDDRKDEQLLETIMSQIADLVQFTQTHAHLPLKGEVPESIHLQVDQLEKDVMFFCKCAEEAMRKADITDEEVKKIVNDPSQVVNPKNRRMLEQAIKLRKEVESTHRGISAALERIHKQEAIEGKGTDDASKRMAHKKKYKRLGGKKGWTPL